MFPPLNKLNINIFINVTESRNAQYRFIPISESAPSLKDLTSIVKDSTLPFHKVSSKLNLFGRSNDAMSQEAEEDIQNSNPVVTADEAVELPPVVPFPAQSLTELRTENRHTRCSLLDEKSNKDVYNISQKGGSVVSYPESKQKFASDILDKIGEQDFEDILYKPHKKKKNKKRASVSGK